MKKRLFLLLAASLFCFISCQDNNDSESQNAETKVCEETWNSKWANAYSREQGGAVPEIDLCGEQNPKWILNKMDAFFFKFAASSYALKIDSIMIYLVKSDDAEYLNIESEILFEQTGQSYEKASTFYSCSGEEVSSSSALDSTLSTQKKELLWKY